MEKLLKSLLLLLSFTLTSSVYAIPNQTQQLGLTSEATQQLTFEELTARLQQLNADKKYKDLVVLGQTYSKLKQFTDEQILEIFDAQLAAIFKHRASAEPIYKDIISSIKQSTKTIQAKSDKPVVSAASTYHLLSKIALDSGEHQKAEQLSKTALDLTSNVPSPLVSDIYYFLGAAQARQGQLREGLESMLNGLKNHDLLNLPRTIQQLVGLGAIYNLLGDYENSVRFSREAMALAKPDSTYMSVIESNLASSLIELGKIAEAIPHMESSLRISNALGQYNYSAVTNLGHTHMLIGNYEQALEYLADAESYYRENTLQHKLAIVLKNTGETYTHLKQHQKANTYFQEAYSIYNDEESGKYKLELFPVMIQNLVNLQQFEQAFVLMSEFKKLTDKANDLDNQKHINRLKTEFDVELKQRALDKLELERILQKDSIETLKREKQTEQQISYLISAVAISLLFVVAVMFKSLFYRNKANKLLQQKNEDIEQLNTKLVQQSRVDTLTDLHNRRYLSDFLDKENANIIRRSLDNKQPEWLLIALDIDHFKLFNDNYGHATGDEALVYFAQTLKKCARESDIVIRWGGEEFLWLCRDTQITEAQSLYHRLQQELSNSAIQHNGEKLNISCSAGIASFPILANVNNVWQLTLEVADQSLYKAKSYGRACWVGYKVNEHTPEFMEIKDVAGAIEKGQLTELRGQ